MDPITFEALTRNPELLQALLRQAHRERAEVVHRLIISPIRRLFSLRIAQRRAGHASA